ncbi:ScyD/ScyE family protein [Deinococcus pimensis]|uniref:ScyD/ScyE family protein n=1 Tax=Deinococcus pimensis TaxID=309888 RepID=UPI00047F6486|nr:ScyD/ScyE family protein [Deinococcus pimensis]
MTPHPRVHVVRLITLTAALITSTLAQDAAAPSNGGTVVLRGLNGPQGVYVARDGSVWVTDSGTGGTGSFTVPGDNDTRQTIRYGETARVIRLDPRTGRSTTLTVPSTLGAEGSEGASRVTELAGQVYVTSGHWAAGASIAPLKNNAAVLRVTGTAVREVASTWALESARDPDKQGADSHAYGLTAGPDGKLWLTDAGGNDLLTLDPTSGTLSVVAVFANLPIDNPGPNLPPSAQPVPTAVAFLGSAAYVSLLPGFPFTPGSSKVVRVARDGATTDYATGLSMTTDLRAGPDGNLYAVQLGQFGEQGPVAGTGSIVRIRAGGAKETVLRGLDTPTSVAFDPAGNAYVSVNGAAAPGTGLVLRFPGLTRLPALR